MLTPDLVLTNGKIWTENPAQPEAAAVAIAGGRIAMVGSSEQALATAGSRTRVVDLRGRRVVPGFNDAHVHMFMGGDSLSSVQLRDAQSAEELRDRIAGYARSSPAGEWILNGSWDHERWTPAALPTHQLIDDATREHPVFVNRSDGHMVLVNALAMRLAGVDKQTQDVPGGEIVRDANGHPTGIFKDAAKALIERAIPAPSQGHILAALDSAQAYAAENGVTSVQDMGVLGARAADTMADVIRAYQRLRAEGRLQVRVSAHIPLPAWKRLADLGVAAGLGDAMFHIGAVKSFSDGSLGSTTAWFFEPYSDAPETTGLPSDELMDADAMYANMREADRAGLQLAIHAIGDRANGTVLDFIERLVAENGQRDRRIRIEHAQHLRPEDIGRFAELGVIASVQPYHAIDDGGWVEKRIGAERAKTTYAFRSLLDAGAMVAFGSDWWVAPINPLLSIYAAVTRRTLDGNYPGGWMPQQKVSVQEAVHAYTVVPAYASGEERIKGSLEPGKVADLAVLSDDIFTIAPEAIRSVTVNVTILDGRVIFERQ